MRYIWYQLYILFTIQKINSGHKYDYLSFKKDWDNVLDIKEGKIILDKLRLRFYINYILLRRGYERRWDL